MSEKDFIKIKVGTGSIGEVELDINSIIDEFCGCSLFRNLSEEEKKEFEQYIPNRFGEIDGEILSGGGIKTFIEFIVRTIFKIFGYLAENVVKLVNEIINLLYSTLIKIPLDTSALAYCSTPVTFNPVGISYINIKKFQEDLKKQINSIKEIQQILRKILKIVSNPQNFIKDQIKEPISNFRVPVPGLPFLNQSNVIPGTDYFDFNKYPQLKELFDITDTGLNIQNLLFKPLEELKTLIPELEIPEVKSFINTEKLDNEIIEYMNEYGKIIKETVPKLNIPELDFLKTYEDFTFIQKSLDKDGNPIGDYVFNKNKFIKKFEFIGKIIKDNTLYNRVKNNNFSLLLDINKIRKNKTEDVEDLLFNQICKTSLLNNSNFHEFILSWVDKYSDYIKESIRIKDNEFRSILKDYITNLDNLNWRNYNPNLFITNDKNVSFIYKSLDLLNINYYKDSKRSEIDKVIFEFLDKMKELDKESLFSIITLFGVKNGYNYKDIPPNFTPTFNEIYDKLNQENIFERSNIGFKNLKWVKYLSYPESIGKEIDPKQIENLFPNIGGLKNLVDSKLSYFISLFETIKSFILLPLNLVIGKIKDLINILKNLIKLRVKEGLQQLLSFLKNFLPNQSIIQKMIDDITLKSGLSVMGLDADFINLETLINYKNDIEKDLKDSELKEKIESIGENINSKVQSVDDLLVNNILSYQEEIIQKSKVYDTKINEWRNNINQKINNIIDGLTNISFENIELFKTETNDKTLNLVNVLNDKYKKILDNLYTYYTTDDKILDFIKKRVYEDTNKKYDLYFGEYKESLKSKYTEEYLNLYKNVNNIQIKKFDDSIDNITEIINKHNIDINISIDYLKDKIVNDFVLDINNTFGASLSKDTINKLNLEDTFIKDSQGVVIEDFFVNQGAKLKLYKEKLNNISKYIEGFYDSLSTGKSDLYGRISSILNNINVSSPNFLDYYSKLEQSKKDCFSLIRNNIDTIDKFQKEQLNQISLKVLELNVNIENIEKIISEKISEQKLFTNVEESMSSYLEKEKTKLLNLQNRVSEKVISVFDSKLVENVRGLKNFEQFSDYFEHISHVASVCLPNLIMKSLKTVCAFMFKKIIDIIKKLNGELKFKLVEYFSITLYPGTLPMGTAGLTVLTGLQVLCNTLYNNLMGDIGEIKII